MRGWLMLVLLGCGSTTGAPAAPQPPACATVAPLADDGTGGYGDWEGTVAGVERELAYNTKRVDALECRLQHSKAGDRQALEDERVQLLDDIRVARGRALATHDIVTGGQTRSSPECMENPLKKGCD